MKKIVILSLLTLILFNCAPEKEIDYSDTPYPINENLAYYQAQCDSGNQAFWTDIKAVTSAFLNNSKYMDYKHNTEDIVILGEGLFHGKVEIPLSDMILRLTLERQFKHRGRKAIWQVTEAEEIPWPSKDSASVR